jgi:hypothetical protein
MATYISSNANRFYAAREGAFGEVAAITAANRFPAVKLSARQTITAAERKDKTGSRTYTGMPPGGRRHSEFEIRTYMTSWTGGGAQPGYGPLFEACLGGAPRVFTGGAAASGSGGSMLVFSAAHNLTPGQAVTHEGELRFVSAVVSSTSVQLNAAFSSTPAPGAPIGGTITYSPAMELPSVSLFDYWDPSTAVQRLLCGTAVNRMTISVNGDYHEFTFSGVAQDLVDSAAFAAGMGQLSAFPQEPELEAFDYSIVPGHMGQAWLGTAAERFHTITHAQFIVDNDLDIRAREFGSSIPKAISPGRRKVTVDFDLYGRDDDATAALYQAARQQSPISLMFQLGEVSGQLFGVYAGSVLPEVPEFDDSERRLQWSFRNSRAQGISDDEFFVAVG